MVCKSFFLLKSLLEIWHKQIAGTIFFPGNHLILQPSVVPNIEMIMKFTCGGVNLSLWFGPYYKQRVHLQKWKCSPLDKTKFPLDVVFHILDIVVILEIYAMIRFDHLSDLMRLRYIVNS